MNGIVCVGTLVLDVFLKPIVSLPEAEKLELVDNLEIHAGGCANNTAVGLSRLGQPVQVVGKVGEDPFGDYVIHSLRGEGACVEGIGRSNDHATSTTIVLVDPSGQRGLIHYIGANADLGPDDIDINSAMGTGLFHVAGTNILPGLDGEPMACILRRAKESGFLTCVDTAWNPGIDFPELIQPILPHLDIFLPNIHEASMITNNSEPVEIARYLLNKGVGTVGIKMGRRGCFVATRDEKFQLPTFDAKTVDTAGAGDAFVAGFLTGILEGLPLEQTAGLANGMGALATTSMGCTTGLPTRKELEAFVESTPLLKER